MAIQPQTLRLVQRLRVQVGKEADAATRTLTQAWVRAWDEVAAAWRVAMDDLVAQAAADGQWPGRWQLARTHRLQMVLDASTDALVKLGDQTGVQVTDAAGQAAQYTADAEPEIITSQLPGGQQTDALSVFAGRGAPQTAVDFLVARTAQQITALTRPLSAQATEAMRRALIRGIAVGSNPRDAARDMVVRVQGQFEGGLNRATVIARTETLDAYRRASQLVDQQNAQVLQGWTWLATLDGRTCPSCWAQHGTTHTLDQPGPLDHQQGRCARIPTLLPWSKLGINTPEPLSVLPDARARFNALSEDEQLHVMGPDRLKLLRTGKVDWSDLSIRRESTGWRPSYGPRPVRDLQRQAGVPVGPTGARRAPAVRAPAKRTTTPAKSKPVKAPAFPANPKVGDLFMNDYTEPKAVTAARQAAVKAQFEGEYAGLTVRVDEVVAHSDAVKVDGTIHLPDGRRVGMFTRAFYREADEVSAYHSLLELDRTVQGQGFADQFNRHLTDWYRRSGVDRIMLHADIDVGGYAWARNGYDFVKAKDADKVLARLRGKVDEYRARAAGLHGEQLAAAQRQITAAEDILTDADRYQFGQVEYPSAYRISQAGRWAGASRDDMWIGKDAMLKSSWHGVKPL